MMDYVNELSLTISKPGGVDMNDVRNAISVLADYTKTHFSYEEKYMRKNKFPNIVEHLKVHADFLVVLDDFMARFKKIYNQEVVSAVELKRLLQKLFKDIQAKYLKHMLADKKKYE